MVYSCECKRMIAEKTLSKMKTWTFIIKGWVEVAAFYMIYSSKFLEKYSVPHEQYSLFSHEWWVLS